MDNLQVLVGASATLVASMSKDPSIYSLLLVYATARFCATSIGALSAAALLMAWYEQVVKKRPKNTRNLNHLATQRLQPYRLPER